MLTAYTSIAAFATSRRSRNSSLGMAVLLSASVNVWVPVVEVVPRRTETAEKGDVRLPEVVVDRFCNPQMIPKRHVPCFLVGIYRIDRPTVRSGVSGRSLQQYDLFRVPGAIRPFQHRERCRTGRWSEVHRRLTIGVVRPRQLHITLLRRGSRDPGHW